MLKETFLNNFLQKVAKNLGYDGTIEGKNTQRKTKKNFRYRHKFFRK